METLTVRERLSFEIIGAFLQAVLGIAPKPICAASHREARQARAMLAAFRMPRKLRRQIRVVTIPAMENRP